MDIFIIEDETIATKLLKRLIVEIDPSMNIVGTADSVSSAIKWLNNNPNPDLIFTDIELSDGQSFDIFEKVNLNVPVVFTTAHDDFALKAFQVNSVDYLLKPVDKEAVEKSLEKYKSLKANFKNETGDTLHSLIATIKNENKQYKSRFLVKMGERLVSLTNDQIAYFFSEDKLVFVMTNESKKYPVDYTLDEIDQTVDPKRFFRLNRQYVSNIDSIVSIHNYFNGKLKLTLKPHVEKEVLVSREKASTFKDWLDR